MDEQQKQSKRNYLPAEFWRALLVVRNNTFRRRKQAYRQQILNGCYEPGSFRNSIDVVDCYLEFATESGWLDDKDETVTPL